MRRRPNHLQSTYTSSINIIRLLTSAPITAQRLRSLARVWNTAGMKYCVFLNRSNNMIR